MTKCRPFFPHVFTRYEECTSADRFWRLGSLSLSRGIRSRKWPLRIRPLLRARQGRFPGLCLSRCWTLIKAALRGHHSVYEMGRIRRPMGAQSLDWHETHSASSSGRPRTVQCRTSIGRAPKMRPVLRNATRSECRMKRTACKGFCSVVTEFYSIFTCLSTRSSSVQDVIEKKRHSHIILHFPVPPNSTQCSKTSPHLIWLRSPNTPRN